MLHGFQDYTNVLQNHSFSHHKTVTYSATALPCNGAWLQCTELLLRVSVRLSTPVEIEISKLIVTTDLQSQ